MNRCNSALASENLTPHLNNKRPILWAFNDYNSHVAFADCLWQRLMPYVMGRNKIMVVLSVIKWRDAHLSTSQSNRYSLEYWQKMPGSDVQVDCLKFLLTWTLSARLLMCAHECFHEHGVLSGRPVAAGEIIAFPFVFVQVFGDYYHFRHHAVEKRALSGHRGMHIRLQKEPQVRLVSALTLLIAALHVGNKRPKDRLDYTQRLCISQVKRMPSSMTACQTLYSFQFTPVLPSVPLTQSKVPHSCKYATETLPNSTTAGNVSLFALPFCPVFICRGKLPFISLTSKHKDIFNP